MARTHTSRLSDLRTLIDQPGPFATALVPARSDVFGAGERMIVQAKNALRNAPDEWDADVDAVQAEIAELSHGEGAALIAIRPLGGPTFFEFVDDGVHRPSLTTGPTPRLAPLLEARQGVLAHVVAETDLSGATITAFDGGEITRRTEVEGETEFIHRGHPGGWSQRRFQQRAENTWEENAKDVADSVRAIADDVDARVVFVTGPTRASSMLVGLLGDLDVVVEVEAGHPEGIAHEIGGYLADLVERDTNDLLDEAADKPELTATSARHVESALAEGRVRTLFVHDAADRIGDGAGRARDRCIAAAIRTDAAIRVVPDVELLDGGLAAILRW